MTIKRSVFDVEYVDPDGSTRLYRTRVVMADRMFAEANGRKFGIADPARQPQLLGALWLYLASRREAHIPAGVEFAEFQTRCVDNGKVEDEDVPPTEAVSGPPSPSHASSPASPGTSGPTTV